MRGEEAIKYFSSHTSWIVGMSMEDFQEFFQLHRSYALIETKGVGIHCIRQAVADAISKLKTIERGAIEKSLVQIVFPQNEIPTVNELGNLAFLSQTLGENILWSMVQAKTMTEDICLRIALEQV